MGATNQLSSILRLRAWKLALAGPTVYWYFPIFFVLLSTHSSVSVVGLTSLFVVLAVSASWGFLLNDLFDRETDSMSGRADSIHGHDLSKRTMWALILGTALVSWIVVFMIGGGYIFKLVLALNYLVSIMYSVQPIKLKRRKFWGFFANAVMERPLPILVFLSYMEYYTIFTAVLPIAVEFTWSVFKHQAADVKEDIASGVSTFATQLGETLSNRIVQSFLNPLSAISLLFLVGISWYYVPALSLSLEVCFGIILLGTIASYAAEKSGKVKTYVTPTDPPYVMFLNVAYRFLLLPILGYGIVESRPTFYPLLVILAITLGFQALLYAKMARQLVPQRTAQTITAAGSG